jgi:hypothetical protein
MAKRRRNPRKKRNTETPVQRIIDRLQAKLYKELGEENADYQEGYGDGMDALARALKLR